MKKRNEVLKMAKRVMIKCINKSGRNGPQVFVNFYPHVDSITFHIYKNKWESGNDPDEEIILYLKGSLMPTVKEAKEILKPINDLFK